MQKYIPVLAGGIILVLIVTGFIVIQTRQSKNTVIKPANTVQSITSVPATQVQVKETPVPAVSDISLVVNSPAKGAVVKRANLTVSGKTVARAEVVVNDVETTADARGNFSVNIVLDEGENTIVVVVNDSDGNFAESELTVTYEAQ